MPSIFTLTQYTSKYKRKFITLVLYLNLEFQTPFHLHFCNISVLPVDLYVLLVKMKYLICRNISFSKVIPVINTNVLLA